MKGYGLKKIPSDIFKFIYLEQLRFKQHKGTNSFSFELTIYALLKEHPRFAEFKKKIEQERNDACD